MSTELETESKRGVSQPSQRDLQRDALRDLLELSEQCAAAEAEMKRRHESLSSDERARLEKAQRDIEFRVRQLQDELRKKYDAQLAQIRADYENETRAATEHDAARRRKLELDMERIGGEVKKNVDQGVWLAESVLEAAQLQIKADGKKAKEETEAQQTALDEMQVEALQLLSQYGQQPGEIPQPDPAQMVVDNPADEYKRLKADAERWLRKLRGLFVPSLFVGYRPILIVIVIVGAAIGWAVYRTGELKFDPREVAIWGGSALGGALLIGLLLKLLANAQVRNTFRPFMASLNEARRAAVANLTAIKAGLSEKNHHAVEKCKVEVQEVKDKYAPIIAKARGKRDSTLESLKAEFTAKTQGASEKRDHKLRELEEWKQSQTAELQAKADNELRKQREKVEGAVSDSLRKYQDSRSELARRWNEGLQVIQEPIKERTGARGQVIPSFSDPRWNEWVPPDTFAAAVRFGELGVDLKKISEGIPRDGQFQLAMPEHFSLPAVLAFPRQSSLLVQYDRSGRDSAMRVMQMVMTRLLTSLPAGRVKFTILDPVGLGQNFAGFMHLADHDDSLVGGRIWTDHEQINQRLVDLTEHMETVIQKYLRNEFETVDDYNAQAGELAEPYRFLVIADFPVGFNDEALRRLSSIATSGARCGVYTLIARDVRQPLPPGTVLDDLESASVNLVQQDDGFIWKDDVFGRFPLELDDPPDEESLTRLMNVVGHAARDANRVEVPFETIAPAAEQFWTGDCTDELRVPIGKMGATRQQLLKLGKGVAQHVLIAGKTGSGKSTLLHALVTNLAMWYSPNEVEFFLIDFKKGVEFKTYATHNLPHARAIAVESDREFGLSVLQRLDAELTRRGELFRKAGVQDLPSYRSTPDAQVMPRTLLMIDEFQEFFTEDDKLAQEAQLLLDRLVRQGRAFGIHVLLGSQTIGGSSGLARTTIGQMAVRVALQCSEADSQLILGDSNSAARLLSRPGEAIYNDAGGLVEGNSPFQIAWLPDAQRERYLELIRRKLDAANGSVRELPAPIVFEGNAPADVTKNQRLMAQIRNPERADIVSSATIYVGDPVAIKDPAAVILRRQSGANVLILGQHEEAAMGITSVAMLSLAAQHSRNAASFYLLDGTPADSPLAGTLQRIREVMPHEVKVIDYRNAAEAINELAEELKRRQSGSDAHPPAIFVFIFGLQRYRVLRKSEDSFGFSMDDADKPPAPDKQFADLLREGPALGIHVITYADTPASVDRTIDRASMREFDHRILFQMSAADSSNLIDSPAANKLGFHRALAYSEEQGVMEKFRPYAVPSKSWLETVKTLLAK